MKSFELEINGKKGLGIEIPLPKAPLVLVKAQKGFVMCGYLNIEAAQSLNEAAAMVKGVKTVEDLLAAKIQLSTAAAQKLGVKEGMTGREALTCLL